MADIKLIVPKILQWEGGYTDDPTDKGGATNHGVTLATWRQVGYDKDGDGDIDRDDIKLLTTDDFTVFLKKRVWDRWKADQIVNQSIAEILVDWTYNSGAWGIKIPQRLLGVIADGQVGTKTIEAVNSTDPGTFYSRLQNARLEFVDAIVKRDPAQAKYIKGWHNRINSYKFY